MKYKNMIIVPSNPRRIRSFSPQNAAIPPLEMRENNIKTAEITQFLGIFQKYDQECVRRD